MTSPRGTLPPDTLLQNRYRILSQIGEGGMGAVYVATDERFGSTVALKETFFRDAALRRAFEREAQLLNRLRHPALPKVSDHFAESEGQFLVMEFIAGDDLSAMLDARGGAFPAEDVLRWADDLLDALDYLHTQEPSIVHRDIKPQNLKLTPRGHVVLLDFGLAKGAPAQTSQATKSVFGYSRSYAPLEQIQGTGTDFRSDLYSLGATLYHLLTNHIPNDALTRAMSVLNSQPDPLRPADELNSQVSPAVASVIARAMAQTASARQQSAAEMREELRRAAGNVSSAPAGFGQGATVDQAARTIPMSSEQETQLFGAHAPQTTAPEPAARATVRAAEAATGETTMVGGAATGVGPAVDERVSFARPRGGTGRAVAAIVGLAVICGGVIGVYKFTRQPAPNAPLQTAAPAPQAAGAGDANAPAAAASPPAPAAGVPPNANQTAAPALARPAQPAPSQSAERRPARERAAGRAPAEEPDDEEVEPGTGTRVDSGAGASENFNFNYNGRRPGGTGAGWPGIVVPPGIEWAKLTPRQRQRLIQRIRRDAMREQGRTPAGVRRTQQRSPPPLPPRPTPTRQP